jgi:hypothetical protein
MSSFIYPSCNAPLGAMTRLEWLTKMWLAKVTSGESLSRSLNTPSCLRGVADLRKSVATARESVLDVSSLKAKSEKREREKGVAY